MENFMQLFEVVGILTINSGLDYKGDIGPDQGIHFHSF